MRRPRMEASHPQRLRRYGRSMTEAEFQDQVVQLLHVLGYRVAHFAPAMNARGNYRTPTRYDAKGFPDLVAVRPEGKRGARIIYAELKSDKGRLSKEQGAWLADLNEAGAEAYVWKPSDWPELSKILR